MAFLFALALAVPVAAGDSVVVGLQLEPPGLDPTRSIDSAIGEIVYKNVFETLTWAAPDGTIKPLLASGWEVSADGRHYILHLRRGVRFHNGVPFDAETVRFSLDRALAPGSLNPQKPALAEIAAVRVVDPYTVKIDLSRPDGNLPFVLALPALAMIEPHSAPTNALNPVGTGPFQFSAWRRGAEVTLARNDAYWGGAAHLATVRFKFIADTGAAYAAVRSGDVDLFPDYPAPENIAAFRRNPKLAVTVGTTEGQVILAINNKRAPFDNLLVRRAISYAINRRDVIAGAFYGFGVPIGSHYAPQDKAYVDLTGLYPYEPAKARALLAQSGYPNGFDVTLKLPPPPYARRSGEIVAAQLAAVGIRVHIETVEWAQWLTQVFTEHDYDLSVVNHIEPMDYDIYGKSDYYFGYDSPRFRDLLAAVQHETKPARRDALLGLVQRQIAEDAVNGFLFELPRLTVRKANLVGYPATSLVPSNAMADVRFSDGAAVASTVTVGRGGLVLLSLAGLVLALWAVRRIGIGFVGRRIGVMLLTLLASSAVIFLALQCLPGDPASYMLGTGATPESLAALRGDMGLDAPAWRRYLGWIAGIFRGDLGISYTYRVPVTTLLGERLAVSLPLTVLALALSFILAVPLGLLAAWRGRRGGLAVLIQIGVVLPDFWLGLLLVLAFAVGLNWFPAGGFPGWDGGVVPALRALVLPAVALAVPQGAILARVLHNALTEALETDYIRAARARGLSAFGVLWCHGLPNAMVPALTVMGMQFSFLIAGAIIVENVFALPGLGRLISQAVVQRDLIVVQAASLVLVAATAGASFLVDIAYALADPRIRPNGGRPR